MIEIVIAVVSFAAGYAFRGLISKELKAVGLELKTVVAEFKTEVATLAAEVKSKL